jgi:hypothetical protein
MSGFTPKNVNQSDIHTKSKKFDGVPQPLCRLCDIFADNQSGEEEPPDLPSETVVSQLTFNFERSVVADQLR